MNILTRKEFYSCYGSDNWSFITACRDTGINNRIINNTISNYQKACKIFPVLFLQPFELYEFALKPNSNYADIQKYWLLMKGTISI